MTNEAEIIIVFIFYPFFLFYTSISHFPISRFISCSTMLQIYDKFSELPKIQQTFYSSALQSGPASRGVKQALDGLSDLTE